MATVEQLVSSANEALVDEKFEQAYRLYSRALADSRSVAVLLRRAQCSERMGRFAHAVEDATAAIAAEPSNVAAHTRRGSALFAAGEFRTALAAFRDAQRLKPSAALDDWVAKSTASLSKLELT